MYKVNVKLTLLSKTLLKVAINGLAIPPGMYHPIPREKVKIHKLKRPITFDFFCPVKGLPSVCRLFFLIWWNLNIIIYAKSATNIQSK